MIKASLEIYSQHASLHFVVDDVGNQIGIAQRLGHRGNQACRSPSIALDKPRPASWVEKQSRAVVAELARQKRQSADVLSRRLGAEMLAPLVRR